MRTTIELDDDVLAAAKHMARRQGKTVGWVISALARQALTHRSKSHAALERSCKTGFLPFAPRGGVATNELIDGLRDEGEY